MDGFGKPDSEGPPAPPPSVDWNALLPRSDRSAVVCPDWVTAADVTSDSTAIVITQRAVGPIRILFLLLDIVALTFFFSLR